MSFNNFHIIVAHEEPRVIRAYSDGKEVFTFTTKKNEVHFSDTMMTMIILKGLLT